MSAPTQTRVRADSPKPAPKDGGSSKQCANKVQQQDSGGRSGKSTIIVAGVCVVSFFAYTYFGSRVDVKAGLEAAVDFVEKQGDTAIWWYIMFTFVGVICLVPTTLMEVSGGFLLGSQYGLWLYPITGATKLCANVVAVLIARHLIKDMVMEKVVKRSEFLTMVAAAAKDEPWKMAFLVRGSMVPLFVKNYGLGVTDIGYIPNACCSMIFTNFYAAQNLYMGSTMKNLKDVFAPKKAAEGPMDPAAYAKKCLPIVFNVLLVFFLVKSLKAQFKKQRSEIEETLKKRNDTKSAAGKAD